MRFASYANVLIIFTGSCKAKRSTSVTFSTYPYLHGFLEEEEIRLVIEDKLLLGTMLVTLKFLGDMPLDYLHNKPNAYSTAGELEKVFLGFPVIAYMVVVLIKFYYRADLF